MTVRLRTIDKTSADYNKIRAIYHRSFKKIDRIPLFVLSLKRHSTLELLGIYDDDLVVGLTYLIHKGDMTFVLYLAIDDKLHSKGYGSLALKEIVSRGNSRIALNIESIDQHATNYNQRIKRKAFYLKNDFQASGVFIKNPDGIMEMLSYQKKVVTFDDYVDLLSVFTTKLFKPFIPIIMKAYKKGD